MRDAIICISGGLAGWGGAEILFGHRPVMGAILVAVAVIIYGSVQLWGERQARLAVEREETGR